VIKERRHHGQAELHFNSLHEFFTFTPERAQVQPEGKSGQRRRPEVRG
jgi:hypothetical protein